ncbi:MAG TPA: VCBS repeat-containing protein [Thermoanaerobaculia bacterium]|nr:VCBS repeat-containing protein [Thermoanaerobaculia bacterium]
MKFVNTLSRELRPKRLLAGAALIGWAFTPGLAVPAAAQATPETASPAAQAAPKAVPPQAAAPANPAPADDDPALLERAPEEPAAATPPPPQPAPPDGKWLTDEEGRSYFVDKLPKEEGFYRRLDEKTVRTRWGIPIEVVKEDDKFFYYKVFKVELVGPERTGPTEEQKREVEAAYKMESQESKRLRAVPFGNGLPQNGQWRNGFDLADINKDGHLDIVHGPARKSLSNPSIFLGDGKGNWRRWSEATFPRLAFDYGDAAAADFNGDGHMDLALGMHLRGMAAMIGDGKGKFTDWGKGLDFKVPRGGEDAEGYSSRAITVVDWNRDGRPDIVTLGEGPRLNMTAGRDAARMAPSQSYGVVVYLNQGDGTWKRQDQGTGSGQIFGDHIITADFNGDQRADLATGSNAQGRKALVNFAREDGGWDPTDIDSLRPNAYVRTVAARDFDRDGRDDLAVGYLAHEAGDWRTAIDIFYSRPDGWERRVLISEPGRDGVTAMDAGDLDGDGHADLVAGTGNGRTWVFAGDGKGFFTRETEVGVPAAGGQCRAYHVRLGDLNGDGDDEFVIAFAGESSALFAPDLCTSGGALQAWDVQKSGAEGPASTENP